MGIVCEAVACRRLPPTATHLVCKRSVIFCGERPIRSLILSFRLDTFALGDTERVNEGPIVGCIFTEIFLAFSLLKVGVAMSHSFDGRWSFSPDGSVSRVGAGR